MNHETGRFGVPKTLTFKTRLSAKAFLYKTSFNRMRIKKHFHINGVALSLALKQGPGATRTEMAY